jgi:hypothetical protein
MCYYSFLIKKAAVWEVFDFTDFIDFNVVWRLCWGITVVSDVYAVERAGCGHTRWAFFVWDPTDCRRAVTSLQGLDEDYYG